MRYRNEAEEIFFKKLPKDKCLLEKDKLLKEAESFAQKVKLRVK